MHVAPRGLRVAHFAVFAAEPRRYCIYQRMQAELKEALMERGLDTSGNKPGLVDRLWEAMSADAEVRLRNACLLM